MELTSEMERAFQLIEGTTQCLYITGKAGTGKTTFLKYIVEHTSKRVIVTASTGIAAINAGGVTLHSLFKIPIDIQNPNTTLRSRINPDSTKLFEKLELLIIDEISMVRPDTIDFVDRVLRLYRMNDEPFGGVQIVMFGDLYQLPPVVRNDEKNVLLQIYRGVYFFYAHVFRECGFQMIELTKVFRQSDDRFVEILNNIRNYKLTNRDMNDLDKLRDRRASRNYDNDYIHICSFRKDVQRINAEMLGTPTHVYEAKLDKDFPEGSAPCDKVLSLREGARVMMLTNDPSKLFCNGSMGTVTSLTDTTIGVRLDTGIDVKIQPYKWSAHEYKVTGDKIEKQDKGCCQQFPVTLAWAITIHKSQGLTFDKIVLHTRKIFAPGQLYVALSRCTSMKGIISESFIDKRFIIPDNELIAFEKAIKANDNIYDRNAYRSMRLK